MSVKELKSDFEAMLQRGIMPIFEFEVVNLESNENEYLDINIRLTEEGELKTDFTLDFDFETETDQSLDYNISGLSEAITTDRNFTEVYIYGHKEEGDK